jgi:scyllo-inositol 2-dehydrogenase (NADP+)
MRAAVSELRPVRVLAHLGLEGAPLLRGLSRRPWLEVEPAGDLRDLRGRQVVLLADGRTPDDEEAEALAAHLGRGGGALLLGPTLGAWSRRPRLAALAGWAPGEPGPEAELRVRPAPGGQISDRLDPELLLRDRLPLGEAPPPDAAVLLTAPWRFTDRPLAVLRSAGAGRLVHLGLGWTPALFASPDFEQLVYRCLLAVAALAPAPPVGVGMYGFGTIGREHAESVEATEGLELRGICDRSPERRVGAAGLFKVATHPAASDLLADPSVDLVVVGVPPSQHCTAVLECLEAGKHVVCEKPFALRGQEVARMLDAAAGAGRVVTVYQSRRWDPDFVALRAAVRAGAIGDPFYLEAFVGGYGHPCSYWHSHEPVSGGTVYDWGSHYVDWVLQLFDGRLVTAVIGAAHKRVWHDVSNADQVRVDLTFEGGEQASFLHSDLAAALKPKWYVLGTAGAAVGEWRREVIHSRAWTGDLVEDQVQAPQALAAISLHRPDGAGGVHVEALALPPRRENGFYRNLADHLLLGEPLAVPAAEAGRIVAVMEAAARSMAAGGRRLDVRI